MSATGSGRLLVFVHRDPDPEVLVVTNMWPEPTRAVYGIFVQRQVESLRRRGVRCDVLYIRGYVSAAAYPLAAGFLLASSARRPGRYRLVHAHAAEAALAARFHVGPPVIASYVGDDVLGDRDGDGRTTSRAAIRSAVIRGHSRLLSGTITKSRIMEAVLPGRVAARNHVIPNGVDAQLFRPLPWAVARDRLGWGDEAVALFAATKPHSPAKRLGLAQRASARAGVRLHIAAGVPPQEMPLLMSAADCLLVTSAVEGSPNVVKEALMCGLPVVSTRVGDVPERLASVEPSRLCAADEVELATALEEITRERRRSDGRQRAAALDEERIAEQLLEVYASFGAGPLARSAR